MIDLTSRQRRRCVLLVMGVLAIGVITATQVVSATGALSSDPLTASEDMFEKYVAPSGPELTLSEAGAIAKAKAASVAAQDPSDVTVVKGDLKEAIAVVAPESTEGDSPTPGQAAWLNSSVYVASIHGNFTLEVAKTPKGEGAPTGANLTLIIDAHTGDVEGRFLGASAPNLARLGAPTVLN